ncbi:MAG TPA: RsmD family RNA methyltransferase [Thermoanaerobaculia bacterium]|nr:RsmD family RNA methyltransferase [Thermoanaerobaculia bacterium]
MRLRRGPGRRLEVPAGARPTTGRAREALLSRWQERLPGAVVLDLFAGSGAVGLGALARGAAEVLFVESSESAIAALRRNAAAMGVAGRCRILRLGLPGGLGRLAPEWSARLDLAFADPPYGFAGWGELLAAVSPLLASDAELAAEHSRRESLPERAGRLVAVDRRLYGETALSFYRREKPGEAYPEADLEDRPVP